jgi:large subunit ribosomal protein L1
MSKKGKKYQEVAKLVDHAKIYTLDEAVELLPKLRTAKFDETIEVCIKLNVDPKQADQNIRGVVTLPAGTGKTIRVAVFTRSARFTALLASRASLLLPSRRTSCLFLKRSRELVLPRLRELTLARPICRSR